MCLKCKGKKGTVQIQFRPQIKFLLGGISVLADLESRIAFLHNMLGYINIWFWSFLVSQLWEQVSLPCPWCSLLLCIPFRLQSFLFVVLLLWLERCGFFPNPNNSTITSSTFSAPKNYGLLWEIRERVPPKSSSLQRFFSRTNRPISHWVSSLTVEVATSLK